MVNPSVLLLILVFLFVVALSTLRFHKFETLPNFSYQPRVKRYLSYQEGRLQTNLE